MPLTKKQTKTLERLVSDLDEVLTCLKTMEVCRKGTKNVTVKSSRDEFSAPDWTAETKTREFYNGEISKIDYVKTLTPISQDIGSHLAKLPDVKSKLSEFIENNQRKTKVLS